MTTPTPTPRTDALVRKLEAEIRANANGTPMEDPASQAIDALADCERELAAAQERVEDLEVRCANAEARAGAFRSALLELRIRLHSAGRRPEECHEMSLIDAAIAEGKK